MVRERVGHFRIIGELGAGGMGRVFAAEDTRSGELRALKFLNPSSLEDHRARARFLREFTMLSSLSHRGICRSYGPHEIEDEFFLELELIPGRNLARILDEGRLPLSTAVSYAMQIAEALRAAHEAGIIHRDIKPSNVMVSPEGNLKILDFGIALLVDATRISAVGEFPGTIAYMAPEQCRSAELDYACDFWSFGVVLYEMATGELPFQPGAIFSSLQSILRRRYRPVHAFEASAPPRLDRICRRCLQPDPADRFSDAGELLRELRILKRELELRSHLLNAWWWLVKRRGRLAFALLLVVAGFFGVRRVQKAVTAYPLPKSHPIQVTSATGWEGDAKISPDGEQIAFSSNRDGNLDIYVVPAVGGDWRRLTHDPASDNQPCWMPDGSAIVFSSDRGAERSLWRVSLDGGEPERVWSGGQDPAISPDGKWLACAIPGPDGEFRIAVTELDGRSPARILTGRQDGVWHHNNPSWDPSGKRILYSSWHGLWIVSPRGGDARRLFEGDAVAALGCWGPRSRYVYFSSAIEGPIAIWRVSLRDPGKLERVTMGTGPEMGPYLCADGTRMAYATPLEDRDLVIRELSLGKDLVLEGTHNDDMATLSPDRSMCCFVSDRLGGRRSLWTIQLGAPAEPRLLVEQEGVIAHPVISPDGEWVAYYRIIEEDRELWVASLQDGSLHQLTHGPTRDVHASWSADSRQLVFVSERSGAFDLWVLELGDDLQPYSMRQITHGEVRPMHPVWTIDPDTIAFIGVDEGWGDLWLVDLDGEEPPRRITVGADLLHLRSKPGDPRLWAMTGYGESGTRIRRLSLDGQLEDAFEQPQLPHDDPPTLFDVSADGRLLTFARTRSRSDVWILQATDGHF